VATERTTPTADLLKRVLVGRRLASSQAEHQLLPKIIALPVFSSDPLSSVAYATEEMMLVLVLAGASALSLKVPLAIGIALLLVIVVTSYRQTVRAYPRGGGSYIVARENLGTLPGLVAAAAILTDYVLTVAVSITAGTVAIVSAVPDWADHTVAIAIALVTLVTLANLRGVKEAGTLFALPTYGFVAVIGVTLVTGLVRCLGGCPAADTSDLPIHAEATLTIFLLARAFSSGATALTGVEAIADGVQAFRRPQSRNAAATLAIMGTISISMFLGITLLAQFIGIRIDEEIAATNSVLSQIGRTVFGDGTVMFYVLQVFTAGILILAANTAFQDFPRLSSILARDRFMPSQFRNRGDRLVFSNGVVVLAGLAILLIWIFDASLTRLIQLYVVGVFTAFTLSQAGMVRRWFRTRAAGWRRGAAINGVGAATTGLVLIVVTITKWKGGAYIVVAAMPVIVIMFLAIRRHYARVARSLRARGLTSTATAEASFALLVRDLDPPTRDAVAYLRAVRPERFTALWIGERAGFPAAARSWSDVAPRMGELVSLGEADRHPAREVRRWIRTHHRTPDDYVVVVVPERVRGGLVAQLVGQRALLALKTALLFEPGVVVADIPLLPSEQAPADRPVEPGRHVVLMPVSGVHDGTVRAALFVKALKPDRAEALFLQSDPEEAQDIVREWHERDLPLPLVLVEAPFRELGPPLLDEIRRYTARADTVVTVVLPELIPRHWWENLLHNQTALYLKRLLLFEPRVVLASVPLHVRDRVEDPGRPRQE
jgi:amino acid transporter